VHNNVVVINPEMMMERIATLHAKIAELKKAKKDVLVV